VAKKISTHWSGIAAEYFVLSQLYRLEHDAYLTLGNRKTIDMHVITNNGDTYTIDVKAVRGYSSWRVGNVTTKQKNHFIVLVAYNNKVKNLETIPEVYIVPSTKLSAKPNKGGANAFKNTYGKYKNNWKFEQNPKTR
jgi:hypothetical protein